MNLSQLRYLIAIVDSGFNISRAAETLHTSQPGISRQIRLFEQQLGAAVLARNRGRIVGLTESGTRAVATARRIVLDMESLNLMSQDFLQQEGGRLIIGTLHTYAISLLAPAISVMLARYPKVVVDVQQPAVPRLFDLVHAGEIDIAVSIGSPSPASGLLGLHVADIPLALYVPEGHPLLGQQGPLTLESLLDYPMICLGSSSTGWGVSSVYKAHGLDLQPAVYAMDASVMQTYVAHGMGIAVAPGSLPTLSGLRAVNVSHLFPPSPVTAVIDPNRYLRNYVYEFLAQLAPRWTRHAVDLAVRDVLFGEPPSRGLTPS